MPDKPAPFVRILNPLNYFLHSARLVLTQHNFGELVVFTLEDNGLLQDLQEAIAIEKGFDLLLVVGGFFNFPVEQVFAVSVPRHAVEKVKELCDTEELGSGEHLWCFAVVAADLLNTEC